jgi:hypothetical protein
MPLLAALVRAGAPAYHAIPYHRNAWVVTSRKSKEEKSVECRMLYTLVLARRVLVVAPTVVYSLVMVYRDSEPIEIW